MFTGRRHSARTCIICSVLSAGLNYTYTMYYTITIKTVRYEAWVSRTKFSVGLVRERGARHNVHRWWFLDRRCMLLSLLAVVVGYAFRYRTAPAVTLPSRGRGNAKSCGAHRRVVPMYANIPSSRTRRRCAIIIINTAINYNNNDKNALFTIRLNIHLCI